MLEKYLKEALEEKLVLVISSKNGKTHHILVDQYNQYKIEYHYVNDTKNYSMKIENVLKCRFLDIDKEKEMQRPFIKNIDRLDAFCAYYKACLNQLKEYETKLAIFDHIFNQLYISPHSLLSSYINGDISVVKDNNSNYQGIPLLLEYSNPSQRAAISNAIKNNISIIEGPPGTGKTTTILSVIANFISEGKKVVVVSKNNSAVNNIQEELEKKPLPQFYVRLGADPIMKELQSKSEQMMKDLKHELEEISEDKEQIQRLAYLKNQLDKNEQHLNDLMKIRGVVNELRNQSRFLEKREKVYHLKERLNEREQKALHTRNANPRNIDRLIRLGKEKKCNFISKLLLKYKYYLSLESLDQKSLAMQAILQEIYLNREIAKRESIIMKSDVTAIKRNLNQLYEEYIKLCSTHFRYLLKDQILPKLSSTKTSHNFSDKMIEIYPLILTTADAFLFNFKSYFKTDKKVDCIIIDEASQCDVLTGIPLLALANKIVVVGDSKQLHAITNIEVDMTIDEPYQYEDNDFLNTMELVFSPPSRSLLEHYRCDYNIINFCNKYYYNNELIIHTNCTDSCMNLINVDAYKGADMVNKGYRNEREIASIQASLIGDADKTFGITPYTKQADLLKKLFIDKNCGTIHTFQGKGNDTVYLSTVLNDLNFCNKHLRGSHNLFTQELVNVAVSRAKKKFILVSDKQYFNKMGKYAPDIKNLIDYIEVYGQELQDKSICIFDYLYKQMSSYKRIDNCDNPYEKKLFDDLKIIVSKVEYLSCIPKIFLIDLVQNREFLKENPATYQYILNGAHADFTILDKRVGKPVLVVELDGGDHANPYQHAHDVMKDEALFACDIPVLRVGSKAAFDFEYLEELVMSKVNQ